MTSRKPPLHRRILLRIWSIWFYCLFLGFYVVMFPLYFVLLAFHTRLTHDWAHRLNTVWGYLITWPVGVRVITRNRNKIDSRKVYIFAPNHSSYLDIPVCNIAIPNSFRFMGKAELSRIPLFGYMFDRLHIAVKRESKVESYKSFLRSKEKLEEGVSLLLYPEGTIPDKKNVVLGRFKDGAFRLAIENQVPVVPVLIIGTERVLPDDRKLLIRPGKVTVIFEDPIETKGMHPDDASELRNRVHRLMLDKLTRHYRTHGHLKPGHA